MSAGVRDGGSAGANKDVMPDLIRHPGPGTPSGEPERVERGRPACSRSVSVRVRPCSSVPARPWSPETRSPKPETAPGPQAADPTPAATTLGELLRARGLTLALAESCTGGGIADAITNVAGSSDYFLGGVVSYSNSAKERLLGVDPDTLAQHGAVSEPVARQMAEGARRVFGADVAAGITGILGPGGGTAEKPVGLVYIGVASPTGTLVERHVWDRDRRTNKALSVSAALAAIIRAVSG